MFFGQVMIGLFPLSREIQSKTLGPFGNCPKKYPKWPILWELNLFCYFGVRLIPEQIKY